MTPLGQQSYADLRRQFDTAVTPILVRRWGDQALIALQGDVRGAPEILCHVVGTFVDAPATHTEIDPLQLASRVLARTIARVGSISGRALPAYVVDVQLIALLLERIGFDGGGGSHARVSGRSMVKWLLDPQALASEVQAQGRRAAERASEPDAAHIVDNFTRVTEGVLRRASRSP